MGARILVLLLGGVLEELSSVFEKSRPRCTGASMAVCGGLLAKQQTLVVIGLIL